MPIKIFASLQVEIIKTNLCVSCGACAASCPVSHIAIVDEVPTPVGLCLSCQTCYYHCPRVSFSVEEVEKVIFGRTRREDEPIGIHRSAYAARSKQRKVLRRCQDGGAVTSILANALATNSVDCAVVTGVEKERPWKPKPVVVSSFEDLVKRAGTNYCASPTLVGLASAVLEYEMGKVAMVGTPCQVRAIRKMQTSPWGHFKLSDAVKLTIGLFCMESFSYNKLHAYLERKGIDLAKIDRFDIKKGQFKVSVRGKEILEVPIKELHHLVRTSCDACGDFTAEFADISVGGVGIPKGWSLVIARTEKGEDALMRAKEAGLLQLKPIEKVKPGLKSAIKLTGIVRGRASKFRTASAK